MAVENKRMQQRYGTYSQFQADKTNLLPNEFASVTADDPNTVSGKALYFNPESGEPTRLLTDEDKEQIDSAVSAAVQTANNAQAGVVGLQTTVNQHTSDIANLDINKIEQTDLQTYAYSKSEVTNILNMALSNYYTAYDINDMLSFNSGTVSNNVLAGKLNYFWVKLGFKVLENQRVSGICLMVIDSPVCTSNNATITIPLPFITAETIKIPVIVGTLQKFYTVESGSNSLEISGIQVGDRVCCSFAYRIGVAVG